MSKYVDSFLFQINYELMAGETDMISTRWLGGLKSLNNTSIQGGIMFDLSCVMNLRLTFENP